MRVNGKEVKNEGHVVGPYVIERKTEDGKTEIYGIYAQPIWSYKEFDRLYPKPVPTVMAFTKDGKRPDLKHPDYVAALKKWQAAREGWSMMTSLAPSNIELDGVDMQDPETWPGIVGKLRDEFSFFEYNQIVKLMDEACGIDPEKMEANRKSFLSRLQGTDSEQTAA